MLHFRFLVFLVLLVLIDFYFYQAIRKVVSNMTITHQKWIKRAWYTFTAIAFLFVLSALLTDFGSWPRWIKMYVTSFLFIVYVSKLIGLFVIMGEDAWRALRYLYLRVTNPPGEPEKVTVGKLIPHRKFISQLSVAAAAVPFSTLLFGMVKGAYDYTVFRLPLKVPNLPAGFEGARILQISDIHTGSFGTGENLREAIRMIADEPADFIFFTGDLVNDSSDEALRLQEMLSEIKSPGGVYSILGNHDYGDYRDWESLEAKEANMELMYKIHRELGWRLLLNENVRLKRGGDEIVLIGVENYSASLRFRKYGDLSKAYKGTEDAAVKLLLTHDPSHWAAQVLAEYPDIAVTFSGHTHGMQFGVEIPGFKWSPAQYIYDQWAGLYYHGTQQIYVNRGLGFLGYAGRVGIKPEITVFELQRA